jgi:AraC family transcriptional regulator, ethanolamine operon transcriptional activator
MNLKINRTFQDIEAASQQLSAFWDVELLQANQGTFRLDLSLAFLGQCTVYDVRTEVGLVAGGQRSDQFVTISPITTDCSSSRFRGREIMPDQLLIMEPRGDVFQQIASGHRQAAVSIPVNLFRRVAMAEFGAGDRVNDLIAWQTYVPDRRKFSRFCRTISAILRSDTASLAGADADVWLTEHVMGLLVDSERCHCDLPSAWRRRQIVRRALDVIHVRLSQPPTILELCEATGASRRTLFYAFNDLLDLSPRAYTKRVRLQAARRMIIDNRDQRCVQRVARKLGFAHEGQFSIDYASAFGESPSKTRQQLIHS